ncbi:MAG: hypothetical protein PW734_04925 [Verrucomicrobium sp.]|nr:hypothetical protein [Verrucomicrobium sp.]
MAETPPPSSPAPGHSPVTPPPPVPVYQVRPGRKRLRRTAELVGLCAVAALCAFWAARVITGHRTVVVDRPSAWFEALKKR